MEYNLVIKRNRHWHMLLYEPHKHFTKWKTPDTEDLILYDYEKSRIGKSREQESGLP